MTHQRHERGAASPLVLFALGGAAAGLVVGLVLGFSGGLDLVDESVVAAANASAPYSVCPGEAPSGSFHRGDRVLATAREQGPSWVQVRSPRSSDERVWVEARYLDVDIDLLSLPIVPCVVIVGVTVESTTTTVIATTTSTTTTSPSTTTSTSTSTTTIIIITTTTTTTLPPPTVGAVTESHDPIWETYDGAPLCLDGPGQFTTTVIAANVTAPAGIQSVTLLWSVGDESGSVAMSPVGGQYRATLGPFDADDPDGVPLNQSLPITVTVRVIDDLGRTATTNTTVTLNDCTFI
jgi:hypothetical protein